MVNIKTPVQISAGEEGSLFKSPRHSCCSCLHRCSTEKMNSLPLNDEHIDGPAPVADDVAIAESNHASDIQDRLELDGVDKPTNKRQRRFTSKKLQLRSIQLKQSS
ncbi:unnamed protein product [Ilex paraguariensis]|uniref:Uncharacterized protein n=1 Tax=Ilex paraguariensis TaxID=185542 RepID=A0ABC8U3G7_9AQUA